MAAPPARPPLPRWLAPAALVVALLGLGVGTLINRVVAGLVALPEDVERTEYVDGAPAAAPDAPLASAGESDEPPPPSRASRPRVPTLKQYSDVIVRRNLFDSTAVYDPDAAAAAGAGECRSDSNVKLLATVVADVPMYSSALVAVGGRDARAVGYVVGEDLGGEGRIVTIDQKRVCVDSGGCFCMGGESMLAARAAGDGKVTEDDGGIQSLGNNRYAVDQSVLDDAMNNVEMLATQLKASPHRGPDGQIDGFRLSAIRKGSLFDKLGIKNGDIVHAVNGREITSTEGALSVYQALKNDKNFSFDISRKNQRQSLEYEVR